MYDQSISYSCFPQQLNINIFFLNTINKKITCIIQNIHITCDIHVKNIK